jgi:hypothetical protein
MDMIRPHVFALVAAARAPLQPPVTFLNTRVPTGAAFRLDYILVVYPRTVAAGAQTSPELEFTLHNTRGVLHNDPPLLFRDVTTPAGGSRLRAAWGWRIEFPPGAVITMEIRNIAAGPVPATVSVTYLSQRGWGRR